MRTPSSSRHITSERVTLSVRLTIAQACAAAEAERALAFNRAARLFVSALELLAPAAGERASLMARLAAALANAGRSADAAAVYFAIPTASMADALDHRQKAAQQLLFAGHIDEGLRVVREVLPHKWDDPARNQGTDAARPARKPDARPPAWTPL